MLLTKPRLLFQHIHVSSELSPCAALALIQTGRARGCSKAACQDPGLGLEPDELHGWVQKLYTALPDGTVQFGHAFSSFSEDADSVRLQFPDQPDIRTRYVVAADGYFSPIREEVLADGPPQFAVRAHHSPPLLLLLSMQHGRV